MSTAATAVLPGERRAHRFLDFGAIALTVLTIIAALVWFFPLYWAVVTSFKLEDEVLRETIELLPEHPTIGAYIYVITNSQLVRWYFNSTITAGAIMVLVIGVGACSGYAISQLRFPGRRLLWWMIVASLMIPVPGLIVNHFIIMADLGFLNSYQGVILPQLIAPVVVMVYKQFFDSVARDFREAAVIDGANEFQILFRVFLPMNWGVTAALAIISFIGAWNAFLWPFLAVKTEDMMTITVGITQVQDAYAIRYARLLASAVMAGLPVALAYVIFQRRVTQSIMLSAGIKG